MNPYLPEESKDNGNDNRYFGEKTPDLKQEVGIETSTPATRIAGVVPGNRKVYPLSTRYSSFRCFEVSVRVIDMDY